MSLEEIELLPVWGRVAFAVRCARCALVVVGRAEDPRDYGTHEEALRAVASAESQLLDGHAAVSPPNDAARAAGHAARAAADAAAYAAAAGIRHSEEYSPRAAAYSAAFAAFAAAEIARNNIANYTKYTTRAASVLAFGDPKGTTESDGEEFIRRQREDYQTALALLRGRSLWDLIPAVWFADGRPGIGYLGPYRVLAVQYWDGFGPIYRAKAMIIDRKVALKVLDSRLIPRLHTDPRAKEQFFREARAQGALTHDHIASIDLVDEENGILFIAMPDLTGQTLASALKTNPRPSFHELIRIACEVAEGLAAAHTAGLVHRDIKPGNVWLEDPARSVKILGFGLAGLETPSGGGPPGPMAATGAVGAPAYMSPEQAKGEPVDHRTDLFSLGGVLYQMATGRAPFDVLDAVVNYDPPPAGEVSPEVPPALSALIRRLLAKNPGDRPRSAGAVAKELAAIDRDLAALDHSRAFLLHRRPQDRNPPGEEELWAGLETIEAAPAYPTRRRDPQLLTLLRGMGSVLNVFPPPRRPARRSVYRSLGRAWRETISSLKVANAKAAVLRPKTGND